MKEISELIQANRSYYTLSLPTMQSLLINLNVSDSSGVIQPLVSMEKNHLISGSLVSLLLADAGMGKTTYLKQLTYQLQASLLPEQLVPLYLHLSRLKTSFNKTLQDFFIANGFADDETTFFKQQYTFILIFDAYDASQGFIPLCQDAGDGLLTWKIQKIIISSRTSYFFNHRDYKNLFVYYQSAKHDPILPNILQMCALDSRIIEPYLDQTTLTPQQRTFIKEDPVYSALSRNTLMLTLMTTRLLQDGIEQDKSIYYRQLFDDWTKWQVKQLEECQLLSLLPISFADMHYKALLYLHAVAKRLYELRTDTTINTSGRGLSRQTKEIKQGWVRFMSDEDILIRFARACCFFESSSPNVPGFINREVITAIQAFDVPLPQLNGSMPLFLNGYEGSERLAASKNNALETQDSIRLAQAVRKLEQEGYSEQDFLRVVLATRYNDTLDIAAANCISVLNYYGFNFSNIDLSHVKIPHANLTEALLAHTDLSYSDCSLVNFHNAVLVGGRLCHAQLTGANFLAGNLFLISPQPVYTLACHPQDPDLVAYGEKNTIIVTHFSDGSIIRQFMGHTEDVWSVAWSTVGMLASGSWDNTIRIWDVTRAETEACLKTLQGHTHYICSVAWSAEGALASGSWDNTIRIWDVMRGETEACLKTLTGHTNYVWSVAWSTEGTLASGSADNTIRIWDVARGETEACLKTLTGHTEEVWSVAWSEEGKLASGSGDATIRIWDVTKASSEACLKTLQGHTNSIHSVAWSEQGKLASGSGDATIRIWDVTRAETETCLKTLAGHIKPVWSIAWSVEGKLVSGGVDQTVQILDVIKLKSEVCLNAPVKHTDYVGSVAWSTIGTLASGSDDTIRIWDVTRGVTEAYLKTRTGYKGKDTGWDTDSIMSVAWSTVGTLAFVGNGYNTTIRIWDVTKAESEVCLKILPGHTGCIYSVAWSAEGTLASGSGDNTIRIWDVTQAETEACLKTLPGHTGCIYSVAWSAEGTLASGSGDNTIRIWDVTKAESEACLKTLQGHTYSVVSVAWSSVGEKLASGSWDNTIRIWDVAGAEGGICLKILTGHTGTVSSMAWSSDDQWLISSSRYEILFWHAQNWYTAPKRLPFGAQSLSLKDTLLAIAHDGSVHVLNLDFKIFSQSLWVMAMPRTLCMQACNVANAIGVSLPMQNLFEKEGAVHNTSELPSESKNTIEFFGNWSQACPTLFGYGYRFSLKKHEASCLTVARLDEHSEEEGHRQLLEAARSSCIYFMERNLRFKTVASTENSFTLESSNPLAAHTKEMFVLFIEIANEIKKTEENTADEEIPFCHIS